MNSLFLTTTFASALTLIYLVLSFRVGYLRGSPVMKLIFSMDEVIPEKKLARNVRAHGNFSEYVPIFLILLLITELQQQFNFHSLLIISIVFLYGRIAHAICFAFYDSSPILRISGMICTYTAIGALAVNLLLGIISELKYSQ